MDINQQGFSLMEVMVSLFIVIIALLGIMKMQVIALQAASNAYFTTQALIRLKSIQAILALHPNNTESLLQIWQTTNQTLLPSPQANVNLHKATLSWHDPLLKTNQKLTVFFNQ